MIGKSIKHVEAAAIDFGGTVNSNPEDCDEDCDSARTAMACSHAVSVSKAWPLLVLHTKPAYRARRMYE